eukprot:2093364-Rhodomonas_salina.1
MPYRLPRPSPPQVSSFLPIQTNDSVPAHRIAQLCGADLCSPLLTPLRRRLRFPCCRCAGAKEANGKPRCATPCAAGAPPLASCCCSSHALAQYSTRQSRA